MGAVFDVAESESRRDGSVIDFGVVGDFEEIIYRYVEHFGQGDEHVGGNVALAKFIITVDLLGAVEDLSNLRLRELRFFTDSS